MYHKEIDTNIHISSFIPSKSLGLFDRIYTCQVKYPFNVGFKMTIQGKDLTQDDFVKMLKIGYENHYEAIKKGIIEDDYFHMFSDLYLEQILIDDENMVIDVVIGS